MYGEVRQTFAACVSSIGLLCTGMWLGWSSVFLRKQDSGETPYKMSKLERLWCVTLMDFGNIIGVIPGMYITEAKGPKTCLMASAIIFELSWLFIIFASGAIMVVIARLLAGIAKGVLFTTVNLYLTEIGETYNRGYLVSYFITSYAFGIILEYFFGYVFTYEMNNYACAVIPLGYFFLLFPIPESPYWCLMKGSRVKAMKSLYWLRECSRNDSIAKKTYVRAEFANMENDIARDKELYWRGNWFDLVRTPAMRRVTQLNIILNILQRAGGSSTTLAYLSIILPNIKVGGRPFMPIYMIAFGFSFLLGGLPCALLIDKLGRKPLIIIGSFLMMIAMCINASICYLETRSDIEVVIWEWLPHLTLLIFPFGYTMGIGIAPRVLCVELHPCHLRIKGVAIANIVAASTSFILNRFVIDFGIKYGNHVVFMFYTITNITTCVYTAIFVFETKQKSYGEIQEILHHNMFNVKTFRTSISRDHTKPSSIREDDK